MTVVTAVRDDVLLLSPRRASPVPAIYPEAERFIRMFHQARPNAGRVETRLAQVWAELAGTGTYRHTPGELAFGARLALRDSGWCPADVPWRGLLVRDLREIRDGATIVAECAQHLRSATGDGRLNPMVSVFAPDTPQRPGPRIRNDQLVRYAGYQDGVGRTVGDRRYIDFTSRVCRLGWRPPTGRGAFDLLPLLVETPDEGVTMASLPRDAVLEVAIVHPDLPWLRAMELRWHAVPVISDRRLSIGGIDYPAAPFNGVYICRAIGADVLAGEAGYGLARQVAGRLGLDTSTDRTLWQDRVMVELNRAVLHSFDAAGVRIEHSAEDYVPAAHDPNRPRFHA